MSKNTKNKSTKNTNVSKAAAPVQTTSSDFGVRLSKSAGRMIGVHTITSRGEVKYNGQFVSQSPNFVTLRDRNKNKLCKIAKNTIISLSGV